MSKLSRNKGANYEREISKTIHEVLGVRVKRNLTQYQQGEEGDLLMGPFVLECKRRKSIAIYEWMAQADAACKPDQVPVVVCRGDGKKSLMVMWLDDGLPLLGNELSLPDPDQESPQGEG